MPPPWVVIPNGAGYKGYSDSFTVLSAPTMNSFQWKPPGGARALCVGSNGGWLAVATSDDGDKVAISLVNPLTDARVELPPVIGWLPHSEPTDIARALDSVVSKVAFAPSPSAQDYTVAYVSRYDRSVEYARAGTDDGWRSLPHLAGGGGIRGEVDVAYRDGKFYYMDRRGRVWVVDMAAPSPSPALLAVFPPLVPGIVSLPGDGALHVVWSRNEGDGTLWSNSNPEMLVMRYDPCSSSWTRPANLGGRAFLIGNHNQSVSVPVDGSSGGAWLRPDSIYFASTPLSDLFAIGIVGRRGMWVFDAVTGEISFATGSSETAEMESNLNWAYSAMFMPCMA